MMDRELVKTLRFFEGLGSHLSTWEVEILAQAEREEEMKACEIRSAVGSLQRFEAKRQGLRSYWSPGLYTEEYSKRVIWASRDEEIETAGFDVQEARDLARPPALFSKEKEERMKVTKVSCEVKLSKAVNNRTWKTVGLATEATLAGEPWQKAQRALYADLAGQNSRRSSPMTPRRPERSPQTPRGAPSTK